MFWAIRQLLVPCNYLRIGHGDTLFQSKKVYDFVLPGGLTAVTAGVCLLLDVPLSIFTQSALFNSVSSLLAILIGFYMAALAAVATFERAGIDEPLRGGDATLKVRNHDGGATEVKKLTYRQFISYLFGYLSFLSFIIYVVLLFVSSTWDRWLRIAKGFVAWPWIMNHLLEPLAFASVFFALWQLFVVSLLGIYFLAERLQSLNDKQN